MVHQNTVTANLLIWETNPAKRNENNKVELYSSLQINEGDLIVGDYSEHGISTYEVLKVIQKRDCKIKGKNHYTVLTKWSSESRLRFANEDLSKVSIALYNLLK